MEEEIKQEEVKQEEKPVESTTTLIDKAASVAERMEAANKKAEELAQRVEAAAARMMLSGKAEAGTPQKTTEQIKADEIDAEVQAALKRYK